MECAQERTVSGLIVLAFFLSVRCQEIIIQQIMNTEIEDINAVISHPTLPNAVLAATKRTLYLVTERGCEVLVGHTSSIPSSCTFSPEFLSAGDMSPSFDKLTGLVHAPYLSEETVVLTDTKNGCLIKLDLSNISTITYSQWIGRCDHTTMGNFPAAFKNVELRAPQSTVYHQLNDSLITILDKSIIITCTLRDETCFDITDVFTPLNRHHAYIAVVNMDIILFSSSDCSYFVLYGGDSTSTELTAMPESYPECDVVNWARSGDFLFNFIDLNGPDVLATAVYADRQQIVVLPITLCLSSQCGMYPNSPITSVHQSDPYDFLFLTAVTGGTKITFLRDLNAASCIPPNKYHKPIHIEAIDTGFCGKTVVDQLSGVKIELCAYKCITTDGCSSFLFNSDTDVCFTLTCIVTQKTEYYEIVDESVCYIFTPDPNKN